ncbi:MAG: S24/S26 family peptidase [Pseudomonadota bacterium]
MFGLYLSRLTDDAMSPQIPFKSLALFRKSRRVQRGDVALVDHPERGLIVRRVFTVNIHGRVDLRGTKRSVSANQRVGTVDPDTVRGKLVLTMKWARFLPYFGPPPPIEDTPDSAEEAQADSNSAALSVSRKIG